MTTNLVRFQRIFRNSILILLAWAALASASFLSRSGNRLLDDKGKEVRITGINWFGLETSNLSPHGLWARDWRGLLIDIRDMGFNTVRIPFCDSIFAPGAEARSITTYGTEPALGINGGAINSDLVGKKPLEILDIIIEGCSKLGLKVILDSHSRNPDGYIVEKLWYTANVPEATWIANWEALAARYKGNSTVIAFDLNNEPHGRLAEEGAQWGTGDAAFDWRLAAEKCGNAILKINPDVLIIVEGVEQVGTVSYWWGGNLTGAKDHPIRLSKPEKLIYSPHEYGPEVFAQPWFADAAFPGNLPAIWDKHFGFLHKEETSHLFVGEFGIRDADSYGGKTGVWFDAFLKYMGTGYSWTFWCLNPNSGDTGGLLAPDWRTPEQWKLDRLKPYLAPLIAGPGPGFPGVGVRKRSANQGTLRMSGSAVILPMALGREHRLEWLTLDGRPVAVQTVHPSQGPRVEMPAMAPGAYLARLTGPEQRGLWKVARGTASGSR